VITAEVGNDSDPSPSRRRRDRIGGPGDTAYESPPATSWEFLATALAVQFCRNLASPAGVVFGLRGTAKSVDVFFKLEMVKMNGAMSQRSRPAPAISRGVPLKFPSTRRYCTFEKLVNTLFRNGECVEMTFLYANPLIG
jgi:hypothetical protein